MFGLTDRGNKITVNSVWVMFWYDRTYMVGIGKIGYKPVQTTEKLKLWLTNPNTRVVQYYRHDTSGQSELSSGHLHLIGGT